jgi:short-subunit dehydrogenase
MVARAERPDRLRERYGPWAVVTGASSGIGRATAARLAASGLNLVLAARSGAILDRFAALLAAEHGVEVRTVAVDLASETGAIELERATRELDVGLLVAAAGFGTSGSFLDGSLAAELDMLGVNCRAVVTLCWHFGRRFAARGRGGLVLMSSIVGFQGMPYAAHYAATKAYVQALGEALAVELRPAGVDVVASAPGPTASGFAERAGMRMGQALTPAAVAEGTLAALGRRTTVLPGFLSKLLVYALVPLPRWARVRVMGRVMAGMTRHRRAADAVFHGG